ncbi:hypothetical protein VC83_03424 [Pseudogymnoascus destructans]|uniref:SET domain-containing protein n=2 Tax=Pseudogymnoascus destructans TaxID=655981 RepID=L8FRN2_PSED2|nr:uncharacterized protein VC83_03424 [Pseudogymnoascus destructans]ELR03547.1 hypothetical protein GMDG_01298 [Pseudogymnoascus destructans 20631-21]OAF60627.1 hypothetical protein VC83_03424 [Pseudogymnoascus destructans]
MPPTTAEREVIEIPDSPTAQSEVIVISDDEVTELLDYRAKKRDLPRIPPIQPAYEPREDGNPESTKSELVDINSPHDALMVSLGTAMSLQSFSSGQGHPAGEDSCYEVLDRILGEIYQEIEKDQASQTSQALRDAQSQLQPKLTSTTHHIYSLQSLEHLQQGGAFASSIAIIHHVAKKTRPQTFLQGKSIIQTPERAVPRYNYYVEIDRSRLANNTRLPPEPAVLDKNSNSEADVEAALLKSMLSCAKLANQSRGREKLSSIREYLPQIRSAYQDCRNYLEKEGLYETFAHKDANHPSYHVEKAFGIPLGSFFDLETHAAKLLKSPTVSLDPLAKTLERYSRESCLICSAHQCHIHGKFDENDSDVNDSDYTTDEENPSNRSSTMYQPYSMPHTRMRAYYRGANSSENESEDDSDFSEQSRRYYCSASCRLNPYNAELVSEGNWTKEDHESMQVLAASPETRKIRRASCLMAPMLGKPCSEVYCHLKKLSNQGIELDDMVNGDGRRSKKFDWRDLEVEHKHDERPQPRPCHHPGQNCFVAGEKCTCVSNKICCDKFCTCPQSCDARYRGCTCTEPCILQKCLCYKLNRECDPDLCHGCNAAESVRSQGPISNTNCHNCEIQRGQGKKVVVGESSIEGIGNGLYLAEPVQEGDFIAEYVGEIIDEAEVDRRDALVQRVGNSYNFALNAEVTIDAMWFGNATRFINHSEVRKNCRAKVLLVNSEHRIGFYAAKSMEAGEELFFDYGKEFKGIEKLKEGVASSKAERKSAKQQRKEPLENTIENGDDEPDDVFGDYAEWFATMTKGKRASDDDEDYIDRGSQQGPKRARPALRNTRGRG